MMTKKNQCHIRSVTLENNNKQEARLLSQTPALNSRDIIDEFKLAIRSSGLTPPEHIEPGHIHKFPGIGKAQGNKSAWCMLFYEENGGVYGDFSTEIKKYWFSNKKQVYDPSKAIKARKEREEKSHKEARYKARKILDNSPKANADHPYLVAKDIPPLAYEYKGALVIRIADIDNNTTSLQFIQGDGSKRFLKDGKIKGCFHHVSGTLSNKGEITICEGFATACTLAQRLSYKKSTSHVGVIAALYADNLLYVGKNIRSRYPDAKITIAGDDDRSTEGNPGRKKAREAASSINASVLFPPFPDHAPRHLSDFNDHHLWLKEVGDE